MYEVCSRSQLHSTRKKNLFINLPTSQHSKPNTDPCSHLHA